MQICTDLGGNNGVMASNLKEISREVENKVMALWHTQIGNNIEDLGSRIWNTGWALKSIWNQTLSALVNGAKENGSGGFQPLKKFPPKNTNKLTIRKMAHFLFLIGLIIKILATKIKATLMKQIWNMIQRWLEKLQKIYIFPNKWVSFRNQSTVCL